MFHVPEENRITDHPLLVSSKKDGNNGPFLIHLSNGRDAYIIASEGNEEIKWEHVSVHIHDGNRNFTPRWDEMCRIKDIFWDDEDVVMQLHPKKSEYINQHPNTLHLWRPTDREIPTPRSIAVGFK